MAEFFDPAIARLSFNCIVSGCYKAYYMMTVVSLPADEAYVSKTGIITFP